MKKTIDAVASLLSLFFKSTNKKYKNQYIYFLFWGLGDSIIISEFLKENIRSNPSKKHIALVSNNSMGFINSEFEFDEIIELSPPWTKKRNKYRILKSRYFNFFKLCLTQDLTKSEKIFSIRNDPRDAFLANILSPKTIISSATKGGSKFVDLDLNLSESVNRYTWNEILFEKILKKKYFIEKKIDNLASSYVLFHTGSTEESKKFPIKKTMEVIRNLNEIHKIKIICESNEVQYFSQNTDNVEIYEISNLNFDSFCSLIKNSSGVFCNDSGPMHLANYFKKITYTVWGSTDPKIWTTPNTFNFIDENISCRPCKNKCINGLDFDHFGKIDTDKISNTIKNNL